MKKKRRKKNEISTKKQASEQLHFFSFDWINLFVHVTLTKEWKENSTFLSPFLMNNDIEDTSVSVSSWRYARICFISINIYITLSLVLSLRLFVLSSYSLEIAVRCSILWLNTSFWDAEAGLAPQMNLLGNLDGIDIYWMRYLMNYYCCFEHYPNGFLFCFVLSIIELTYVNDLYWNETIQIEACLIPENLLVKYFLIPFDLFLSKKNLSVERKYTTHT